MDDMSAQGDTRTQGPAAAAPSGVQNAAPHEAKAAVVPDWLANLASLGWRLVVIAALAVALWSLANLLWTVTASIAVAVVISALFAPYVLRLRAQGRSRTAAAGIIWAVAILGIGAVLVVLAIAFVPYLVEIVQRIDAGITQLQAQLAALQVPPFVGEIVRGIFGFVRDTSGDAAGGLVASVAGFVTVLVLATFLVFFFLRDGDRAWLWAFQAMPDSKRERITAAGDDALTRVGGYLRGTTMLSAIIAGTDLVFMLLLNVPLAVPLAVLVFLSGYIPYFGGIVTTAIILLVTWAALGPGPVLVMLILIGIRNVILGYGIRPALYGKSVNIHPALVLIALPAGFQIAGILGLFAAVPVVAVVFAVSTATVAILDPDPRPELPGLVPAWVDRVAQWSWRLLVVLAMVALLVGVFVAIPAVLIPVVIATIIAASLDPVVDALGRRGWSRTRAAALTVGGGALVTVAMLALAIVSLVGVAQPMADAAASGAASVNGSAGGTLGMAVDAVRVGMREIVGVVLTAADAIVTLAAIAVLSALLSFYFLRDGAKLGGRIVSRARPDAAPQLRMIGSRAFDVLGGYMGGTAAISFVGAASQLVIMLVLGIPYALPVFVLSFFLCFIPYIGGFISTGIAFLITVATGTPADIAIMAVWTLVFNIVTGNIVSPLVYGRTVHLHPAIVLVAIPAGSAIAGVLGMFLVVPAIGIVAATWRTVLAVMGTRAAERAADAHGQAPPVPPEGGAGAVGHTPAPDPLAT